MTVTKWIKLFVLGVIATFGAIVSFQHMHAEILTSTRESVEAAFLLPITVDALMVGGAVHIRTIQKSGARGVRKFVKYLKGYTGVISGLLASLWANLVHAGTSDPIAIFWAVWPVWALFLAFEYVVGDVLEMVQKAAKAKKTDNTDKPTQQPQQPKKWSELTEEEKTARRREAAEKGKATKAAKAAEDAAIAKAKAVTGM